MAGVAGCGSVNLLNNGFNGTRTPVTAVQAGLGREDRRTIVGGRWEHDFDNTTTWRNQFVFDDRNISQPTGATSAIGDFPSYNYMSDVTKRGEIFGMESTTYFGAFYNTLTASSDTRNVMPGGNAKLGLLAEQHLERHVELRRSRARRAQADAEPDGGRRHRMGSNPSEGDQHLLRLQHAQCSNGDARSADSRRPAIPKHRARARAALQAESRMAVSRARRHRIRHAAGRQPLRPLERSERQQYAAKDADRTLVTTSGSTGRRTTRSNSARPASTNSSKTSWFRRPPRSAHPMQASRSTPRNRNIAA